MRWSIERAVVGFLSGAAVFVQGVIDAVSPPNFQPVGDSHPIPGCPDAVECRTHGCAEECSESLEAEESAAMPCPCGGTCPRECDRTQQGCVQTWGPDDEHAEALCLNRTSLAAGARCEGNSPAGVSGSPPESPPAGCTTDLAEEIADAVGDHYDNGRAVDPHILWHEAGMPAAIDWTGVATTLLRYFTITPK